MTATLSTALCIRSIGSSRTFSPDSSESLVDCLDDLFSCMHEPYKWNRRPIDIQCALDNTTTRFHRSFDQTGFDCVDTRQESLRKRTTMGNMFGNIFGKKHYRILMLGLGKTEHGRSAVFVWLLFRQRGQNIHSLSLASQRTDHNDPYRWIQCWNCTLGTREIQCLGRRRTSKIDLIKNFRWAHRCLKTEISSICVVVLG